MGADNARQFGMHHEVVEDDRNTIRHPEVSLIRKSLAHHAKLSHSIVNELSSFADVQVKCLR